MAVRARVIVGAVLAVALIGGLGVIDVATGPDFGLSLFYLLPVAAAGWQLGRLPSVVVAAAAATTWLVADLHVRGSGAPAISVWNGMTRLVTFVAIAVMLDLLRRDREALSALARTDGLTELSNARAFRERLADELPRLRRRGAPFCVAVIDLDDFKKLNDRLGHAAGDDALREVGRCLRETVREGDLSARLGGDEFAVVLWDSHAAEGEAVARRLLDSLQGALSARPDRPVDVGATVGLACFAKTPAGVDEVLAEADRAMYAAKSAGKGRVAIRRAG